MRILDFFRDDTMFYVKLRRLVLPLAFQQFMLAAVSASDALMLGGRFPAGEGAGTSVPARLHR